MFVVSNAYIVIVLSQFSKVEMELLFVSIIASSILVLNVATISIFAFMERERQRFEGKLRTINLVFSSKNIALD